MNISHENRTRAPWCAILGLFASLFLLAGSALAGENLRKVYRGKLDYRENAGGVDWSVGPEDVWKLSSFSYELAGEFELELGPSTVVFGKHKGAKKGYSVVWAALFPEEPGEIVTSESGHGDHARAIFMRFNPTLLAELFPSATVEGRGEARWLVWAKRQYGHKINACWQWDNMPVVTWKKSVVFDIDTVEGKRRMYMLDTKDETARYEQAFAGRVLPPVPEDDLEREEAVEIFRQAWEAFDAEYAMFVVKPNVDWEALYELYEPLAEDAKSTYELAGVIGLLVSHLEDLHVYVKAGDVWIPTYNRFRVRNANWNALKGPLQKLKEGKGVAWARTNYGLGYICVWNLSEPNLDDEFDDALNGLGDTVGLIIDLRFNGGGDELLGQRLASRFLDRERTYSLNQYRSGAGHDELGKKLERKFEPRGPWRYEAPVVVLQGQKTMSSAESLALMFAQCPEVTTMGDRTAGSSANPRRLELPRGIIVNLPRWLDMDPAGEPIDAVGIAPMKPIKATTVADFEETDPVFEAAVKFLKKKNNRKPGKRK